MIIVLIREERRLMLTGIISRIVARINIKQTVKQLLNELINSETTANSI